jgi:hypothetical protein
MLTKTVKENEMKIIGAETLSIKTFRIMTQQANKSLNYHNILSSF